MDVVFVGVLGMLAASFAGVIAGRLATGQSIFWGHSRCDACGDKLGPLALVPVVSFLLGRGRSHCCGTRLSALLPFSELLLGGLFILTYLKLGVQWALPLFLLALTLLLAIVLYDLAHQILPPRLLALFCGVSAGTGLLLSGSVEFWISELLVALSLGGLLLFVHVVSRGRAMGLADTPLVFALALLVGPDALTGFLFSFWIGAGIGIMILVGRPRGSRMGVEVPFAPFLAAGFLLAYFTSWTPLLVALL